MAKINSTRPAITPTKFSDALAQAFKLPAKTLRQIPSRHGKPDCFDGARFVLGMPRLSRVVDLCERYPWLRTKVQAPCGCRLVWADVLLTAMHLVDSHVSGAKGWTRRDLIAWLREIEPADAISEGKRRRHCGPVRFSREISDADRRFLAAIGASWGDEGVPDAH